MFSLLDDIVTRSAKQNGTKPGGDIVTMLLKKRFLSSPFAFGMTISHYRDARAGRGLRDDDYDDIFGEGQADEEEGLWEHDEAERLRESKASDPLSAAEPGQLEKLADWGLSYESRPDSRLDAAAHLPRRGLPARRHALDQRAGRGVHRVRPHRSTGCTAYCTQRGYADRLAVIEGATPTEDREYIRSQFTADPTEEPVRVLLATDAAGEGIDLQTHCHRLVNFDIPFNPSRLEQRIGRIDRYGQTETPEVFHFVPDDRSSTYAADANFMARIARKIAQVEVDLGSANQVIGDEIQEHFARRKPAKRKAKGARRQPGDPGSLGRRHRTQHPAHRAGTRVRRLARRSAPGTAEPASRGRHRASDQPPASAGAGRRCRHRRRGVRDAAVEPGLAGHPQGLGHPAETRCAAPDHVRPDRRRRTRRSGVRPPRTSDRAESATAAAPLAVECGFHR